MGCMDGFFKTVLMTLTFVLLLSGVILVAVGAVAHATYNSYASFVGDVYASAALVFLVLGVVALLLALCGCCGAAVDNAVVVTGFAVILAGAVIVEVATGVVVYVYKGEIRTELVSALSNYDLAPDSAHAGVKATWDAVQNDFDCCGVDSYRNWENATKLQEMFPGSVPDSCCKKEIADCGHGALQNPGDKIFVDGCFTKFASEITSNVGWFAGGLAVVVVAQIILVFVACGLAARIRRKQNYV